MLKSFQGNINQVHLLENQKQKNDNKSSKLKEFRTLQESGDNGNSFDGGN